MCFSRPKSWIRGDDLRVGLILQIMTMIERKSSARAKAPREDSATVSQGTQTLRSSMRFAPSMAKNAPTSNLSVSSVAAMGFNRWAVSAFCG